MQNTNAQPVPHHAHAAGPHSDVNRSEGKSVAHPQDRFIREKECKLLTGVSRTTRWRLEQEDAFPRRIQLTANAVA